MVDIFSGTFTPFIYKIIDYRYWAQITLYNNK